MLAMTMFEENKWGKNLRNQREVPVEVPQAVEEVGNRTEDLEILSIIGTGKLQVIVGDVQKTLQTTTAKLEEFVQFIIQNKKLIELEHIPFHLHKGFTAADESIQLSNGDTADDHVRKVNLHGESEKYDMDLVDHPDVVPSLRSIAGMTCASNYGEELCRAFINLHKVALDEQFVILVLKKVSRLCIEDVYLVEGNDLVEIINKWCLSMMIIIQVFLVSEKNLCDQIFEEFGYNGMNFLLGISTPLLLHLLNTAEAIAERPHEQAESSFLLQMHEVLVNLLPDANSLFLEEDGSSVRLKFQCLLDKLTGMELLVVCKKVWDEHLTTLGVNKFTSIHDLMLLQGPNLVKIMKVWSKAIKIIVLDYLARKENLIFTKFNSVGTNFLLTISIACCLHLLFISETMADRLLLKIFVNQYFGFDPEDSFVLLDTREVLVGLLPEINSVFPEVQVESSLGINFHTILRNLRDSARAAVLEFEKSLTSTTNIEYWVLQLVKNIITKISTSLDNSDDALNLLVGKQGAMQQKQRTSFAFSPMATYMRAVVTARVRSRYRIQKVQHSTMLLGMGSEEQRSLQMFSISKACACVQLGRNLVPDLGNPANMEDHATADVVADVEGHKAGNGLRGRKWQMLWLICVKLSSSTFRSSMRRQDGSCIVLIRLVHVDTQSLISRPNFGCKLTRQIGNVVE
ncbi:Exocyst complex subunit Exo70, C-terminal [Dillenia turbinata]|uniref:Exocyst subunit Exo70 family protein n=1 Tax=Dillenia turbinata TaxID=194707 RepID=A0AAN8Z545_9MAGN